MTKSTAVYTLAGIIFTSVAGVLLHFAYEWTGCNPLAAAFCAVNESVWEHLKLLFFPCFLFFFIEKYRTGSEHPGLFSCRTVWLIIGMLFIIAGFYTYSGVIGRNFAAVDIILFFLAVIIVYLGSTRYFQNHQNIGVSSPCAAAILLTAAFLFVFFTYRPAHLALFLDPVTFTYGIHSNIISMQ